VNEGNRKGWTFDTAMMMGAAVATCIVVWVRTARTGDNKAVDTAMVAAKTALAETATGSAREFEGVRSEIKDLQKVIATGLETLTRALAEAAGAEKQSEKVGSRIVKTIAATAGVVSVVAFIIYVVAGGPTP
jgi:hypothetical protein